MTNIFEKDVLIQKLEQNLINCNDGKCPTIRQGFVHLSHSKNKLTINYWGLSALLLPIFLIAIITSMIETDDSKEAILNSTWLAIAIGITSIWFTRQISERQVKHEKWSRYSQHATLYFYDKEWDLSINNYDKSLEFIPDDIQALNNAGAALSELEKYVNAIPYFKKILEIESENTDALSNMGYCLQNIFYVDDAIKAYQKAIELKPDYSTAVNNLGSLYLQERQYNLALEQFENAIIINPNDPLPWTNKAVVLNVLNKDKEAILACNTALKIEPKYAEALIQKSIALFHLKQYDEVLSVGNIYLKLKPLNTKQNPKKLVQSRILFQMGVALASSNKFKEALQHFNEYLVIVPGDKYALTYKGNCLFNLKKYQNAIDAYDDSLKVDSDQPDVLSFKGSALWNSRKFVQSLLCLGEAIRIQPTFVMAHYMKGDFLSINKNNFEIVQEAHQQVLQSESDDTTYIFHKAKSMIVLGQPTEAIILLDKILEKEPKNLDVLYLKAATFRSQENYDDAILVFDKILELFPNEIAALADKGLNLASKEDYGNAIKIYNEALQIESKSHTILMNKGVALTSIGHLERAIQTCFNVIIDQNPVHFDAIYSKGKAFFKQKKFNEALDCQSEAIEIKPDFYGSYLERGNCFFELGLYEKAVKEYHAVKSLTPEEIQVNANLSSAYVKIMDYSNAWKYWYEFLNNSKMDHNWIDSFITHVNTFGIHSIKIMKAKEGILISF